MDFGLLRNMYQVINGKELSATDDDIDGWLGSHPKYKDEYRAAYSAGTVAEFLTKNVTDILMDISNPGEAGFSMSKNPEFTADEEAYITSLVAHTPGGAEKVKQIVRDFAAFSVNTSGLRLNRIQCSLMAAADALVQFKAPMAELDIRTYHSSTQLLSDNFSLMCGHGYTHDKTSEQLARFIQEWGGDIFNRNDLATYTKLLFTRAYLLTILDADLKPVIRSTSNNATVSMVQELLENGYGLTYDLSPRIENELKNYPSEDDAQTVYELAVRVANTAGYRAEEVSLNGSAYRCHEYNLFKASYKKMFKTVLTMTPFVLAGILSHEGYVGVFEGEGLHPWFGARIRDMLMVVQDYVTDPEDHGYSVLKACWNFDKVISSRGARLPTAQEISARVSHTTYETMWYDRNNCRKDFYSSLHNFISALVNDNLPVYTGLSTGGIV